LRVTVTSLEPARPIEVAWRFWREQDRQIVLTRQTLQTTDPAPSTVTKTYPLDAGALLNLRIASGSTPVHYGLVWVQVQVVRGFEGAVDVIGTVLQGFLSTQNDLGWPGSPIEKQDQAAGFIISQPPTSLGGFTARWIVPTGQRWRVICGRGVVACGGVVANRFPTVFTRDGSAQVTYLDVSEVGFPAGSTTGVSFGAGASRSVGAGSGAISLSWPSDLELNGGCDVFMDVFNGQAGDTIGSTTLFVRTRVDG
jgi:hypothetical protein